MIRKRVKIHSFTGSYNNLYRGPDDSTFILLRSKRSYSVHVPVDTGIHPTLNTRGVTVWGDSTVVRQS
jgi:hypothetical protein